MPNITDKPIIPEPSFIPDPRFYVLIRACPNNNNNFIFITSIYLFVPNPAERTI